MTGRTTILMGVLLAALIASSASGISVTASVDHDQVALGDPITLKITIAGKGGTLPEPKMPDLSDFEVYSSGRSQNISIMNGAFASTLDLTYILVPKKMGDLMIGPVTVSDKDGMASTDPIRITVKQPGAASNVPQQKQPQQRAQPAQKGEDFFIDQSVDKSNPYVGQQVTLTFKFYQAVNLWDQPALEWPKYIGLTVEDLPPNMRYYDVVNGRRYLVTEIKRALFPIAPGKLAIDTPRMTIKPDDFGAAMDPFNFFDRDMRDLFKRGQPKILVAQTINLNVRPLPERGKPDDFTGAVGKFSINVETDKDSVGVDEPITMKVILTGTGNIKSIPAVKMPELTDFRVYDSGNTESISNSNQVISGAKTFEQALIPKTSGDFTLPSISLSYFDPSTADYHTVKTAPLKITASGVGLADVGGAPKNIIGKGKKSLGYIITDFPKPDGRGDLSSNVLFWFLQVIPAAAVVAAMFYRSHSKRLLSDRGYARKVGAVRRLRSIFKEACAEKAKGDYVAFCGALSDAVLGFVADRLNLEKSGLTIDHLNLESRISSDAKGELIPFLEKCQSARFAPVALDQVRADELLEQASALVDKLARVI